jgi:D-lactate dehydrogenase
MSPVAAWPSLPLRSVRMEILLPREGLRVLHSMRARRARAERFAMKAGGNPMIDLLKETTLFSALDETALAALESTLSRETFEPGEVLCREGDLGDRMFLIESGEAAVLKSVGDGDPVEVTVLRRGDIAGEMGLFGDRTRTATLRASSACAAWVLGYDDFEALLDREGSVAKGLLANMSRHLARETSTAAILRAKEEGRGLRVAFFSANPYRNRLYTEQNRFGFGLKFFLPRLTLDTVPLATGFRVIVVSANDSLDANVVDALHELGVEMIALRCAGYNNVNLDACKRFGISIARVPAYSPHAVAEHAIALMMALNRRTHRAHIRVRDGNFSLSGLVGFDMHGKTAGVIGTGKIGTCLLSILRGFGCRLLAHSRTEKADLVETYGLRYVSLDDLFAESDIISLHCELTPETYHMIDAEAIAKMKDGVMLINTARGGLIDTEALIDGLKSRKVGYAGLDVYEEEANYFYKDFSDDVIEDDALARLTTFSNVMVTGHQGSLTDVAQTNIVDTTLENIREFQMGMRGKNLTNVVPGSA